MNTVQSLFFCIIFTLSGHVLATQGKEENQPFKITSIANRRQIRSLTGWQDSTFIFSFDNLEIPVVYGDQKWDDYTLEDAQKELEKNPNALHDACKPYKGGSYQKAKMLIEAGANVNGKGGIELWTPLHYAACNDARVLDLLIKSGAEIMMETTDCVTPLDLAAQQGTPEHIELLVNAGADIEHKCDLFSSTPLLKAAADYFCRNNAIKLVQLGADVNKKDSSGFTALHCAASAKSIDLTRILLEKSADPFAQVFQYAHQGRTPLHCAAHECSAAICALILGNLGLYDEAYEDELNSQFTLQELAISKLLSDTAGFKAIIQRCGYTFDFAKEMIVQSIAEHLDELADAEFNAKFIETLRNDFIGEYYRKKLFELAHKLVLIQDSQGDTALEVVYKTKPIKYIDKQQTIGLLEQVQAAQSYEELPEEVRLIANKGIKRHVQFQK